jgi:hypothetical protein
MAEFIEILSPSALKDLQTANTEVLTLIKNIDNAGKSMQNIKTPSGSDSAVKNLNAGLIQQEKLLQKQQIALDKARLSEIKLQQQREKAFDKYEAQLTKEQAKLTQANSLYNQTQQKVNQLSKAYNDLAIKKELGGNLTTKELTQLSKLTNQINIYQTALKKVDADIQKNNRNVGNYASGWNGLGNSINQLSREMPAFANSVQTGFMALSNNIPMLFDEITKIKNANKDLIAQGLPVRSTFSQIAGAVLSWQTALSVGVTLLTIYGAKIWDSISGAKEKKKALEAEKKAIEEKVEAERRSNDAIGQSIAQEQNRARILFEIAKNQDVNDNKRNEALKELRDRYGKYLKDLTDEQILAGQTAEAEERLNKALIGRGYALATQNLLEQNATAQMSAQVEFQKVIFKNFKDINAQKNDKGAIKNNEDYFASLRKSNKATSEAEKLLNAKLKPLKEEEELLLNLFRDNAKYLDAINDQTKKLNDNTKAKKENNKEDEKKGEFLSKERLQFQISTLQKELELTSKLNPTYQFLSDTLKQVNALYDALYGEKKVVKAQKEIIDAIELTDEAVYADYFAWLKLKEATDSYIKTLTDGAFNKAFDNIGLSSAKMFLDFDKNGQTTFDRLMEGADTLQEKFAITFQAVGDVAQDVFNKMIELSNQRFTNELTNLEQEKEIALLFAGESASAREEIERQYEARQREIKRREFQAKKQQAIFNIVIDTAQGVVSALASTPPNVPLSIAIGAIGAVQAGLVASQQVPQFWKGTDNAPKGWALTQERGREIITDSKGNIKSLGNDKGAQYTYLNKGDKVLNNDKTMDYLMFNNDLNAMLTNNDIAMPKVNIETPEIDLTPVIDAINNKESVSLNIGKDGLDVYVRNGHTTKEILNRKVNFVGKSV